MLIDCLLRLLRHVPRNSLVTEAYFWLLRGVSKTGPEEHAYLGSKQLLEKLIDLYMGNASIAPPELTNVDMVQTRNIHLQQRPQREEMDRATDLDSFVPLLCELATTATARGLEPMDKLAQTLLTAQDFFPAFFLNEATTFERARAINRFLAHLSTVNDNVVGAVMNGVVLQLGEYDYDQIRPLARVLFGLLKIPGQGQEKRVAEVLRHFLHAMEKNEIYWKETDICIEWLIRWARALPPVEAYLRSPVARKQLEMLEEWVRQNPTIPRESHRTRAVTPPYKPKDRLYTATTVHAPYGLSMQGKLEALRALCSDQPLPEGELHEDSDIERQQRVLRVGDKVDGRDALKEWLPGEVVHVTDDGRLVEVHYLNYNSKWDEWIEVASPRIQPEATFSRFNPPKPKKPARTTYSDYNAY